MRRPWVKKQIEPFAFARMLAKTAHCTAVAEYGVNGFIPLLKDAILEGKGIPYYVGCAQTRTPPPYPMKNWARIEIKNVSNTKYVVVFLRLFAYVQAEDAPEIGTPIYSVVVGEFIPWWARLARYIGWPQHSSDRTLSLAV